MKTERRHELQTNDLASWLTKFIEQSKPYWKPFLGVLILALVAFFAWHLVNSRNEASRSLAWTAYFNAFETGDAEAFRKVGQSYPETGAAMWALQSAGDAALVAGAGQIFRDRDAANEELETARDAYQKLLEQIDGAGLSGEAAEMLKQRAHLGMGQALESLGEFTEAEQQYQAVLDEFPDSVAAGLARERIEVLKQQSTRDWYAWLANQKPAPSPLTTGLDNLPADLPDNPDLNLPNPGQLLTPDTSSTTAPGDTLLQPSDTTSGDESGLPLFGPENSTEDGSSTEGDSLKLLELPGDTTDDSPTEGTSPDTSSAEDTGSDSPAAEGAGQNSGDETTGKDAADESNGS